MALKHVSIPQALRRANFWDRKYLNTHIQAIRVGARGRDGGDDLIERYLSAEGAHEFASTNPFSKDVHLRTLLSSVLYHFERGRKKGRGEEFEAPEDGIAFAMVTFTDRAWATCDKDIQFDLDKAKLKVRNALKGISFLGRFEAAVYVNEIYEQGGVRGKLVLWHCHVLAWATSASVLKRQAAFVRKRFDAPKHGRSSVRVDKRNEEDIPGTLAYMSKMLTLGYRIIKKGDKWGQKKATMRHSQRRKLFDFMRDYSVFDFWFSGGGGSQFLREAKSDLMRRKKRGQAWRYIRQHKPLVDFRR